MRLEYIGLSELSGSLIALQGVKDVAFDEMAVITLDNGARRYGRGAPAGAAAWPCPSGTTGGRGPPSPWRRSPSTRCPAATS